MAFPLKAVAGGGAAVLPPSPRRSPAPTKGGKVEPSSGVAKRWNDIIDIWHEGDEDKVKALCVELYGAPKTNLDDTLSYRSVSELCALAVPVAVAGGVSQG